MIIEDNGIGFKPEEIAAKGLLSSGHLGLLGMAERAELAGGSLQIESGSGQGTTLYLTFPMPR